MRIHSRIARKRDSRKITKRLKRGGWVLLGTNGSHQVFGKGARRVSITHSRKDLPIGMVLEIEEAVGWKGR